MFTPLDVGLVMAGRQYNNSWWSDM